MKKNEGNKLKAYADVVVSLEYCPFEDGAITIDDVQNWVNEAQKNGFSGDTKLSECMLVVEMHSKNVVGGAEDYLLVFKPTGKEAV